jgi:replicative DNA helicase Mcm
MPTTSSDELTTLFHNLYRTHYDTEINELAESQSDTIQALTLDLNTIAEFNTDLAEDARTKPQAIIEYAQEALRTYDIDHDTTLSNIRIALTDPRTITRISELRAEHNDTLVSIPGTVRSTSAVTSYPTEAAFECQRCGTQTYIPQKTSLTSDNLDTPHECLGCEQKGPFELDTNSSEYIDVQQLRIESTLSDPEIENPESIIAVAKHDLVNTAKPGDTVTITGIVELLGYGNDSPTLDATINDKYIIISSINDLEPGSLTTITDDDKHAIVEHSNQPDITQRIVDSIAPHVPGQETAKLAVALQLFGGITKTLDDGTTITGNIHIGLLTDPGIFTDEIIEYATQIAPKSVEVDGTDTTQVGLTTAAYKSSSGRKSWELDAGALVLADNGLAGITQTNQLSSDAQAALYSVMRNQEVKASKGTATQTLPAETSVLASIQPKYGRFDQYEPLNDQITIDRALLSRFDLLFTLTDTPNETQDTEQATELLDTNHAGEINAQLAQSPISEHSEEDVETLLEDITPPLSANLLRKYITHAKHTCFPTLTEEAKTRLEQYYVTTRTKHDGPHSPAPISAQKLESLVRLAEASARMRLSDTITETDAERVIELVQSTFYGQQSQPADDEDTDTTDEGVYPDTPDELKDLVKNTISIISEKHREGAPVDDVIDETLKTVSDGDVSAGDVEATIEKLRTLGEVYEPKQGHLRAT